jgi:transporter family protein
MEALPVAALWGLSVTAQKYSLSSVKPSTAFIIITLIHACFLLPYLAYNWKSFSEDFGNVSNRLSVVLLTGVTASFIGNIIYYRSLNAHSAPVVSSVMSTVPVFVTLFAFVLLGTRLTMKQTIGILIVMVGINFLK